MDWFSQCQNNVTEWDIGFDFRLGQHYKFATECALSQDSTHPDMN